jgi:hypothetical protein
MTGIYDKITGLVSTYISGCENIYISLGPVCIIGCNHISCEKIFVYYITNNDIYR